jgi:hypothetical protein
LGWWWQLFSCIIKKKGERICILLNKHFVSYATHFIRIVVLQMVLFHFSFW